MTIDRQIFGEIGRITIKDRFDASVYQDFKHATVVLINDPDVKKIEVDLSGTQYLDSAALGMLAQLNEKGSKSKKTITLISIPGRVAEILKVANADKLFSIYLPSGVKLDLKNKY